jgi:hypothetical protein
MIMEDLRTKQMVQALLNLRRLPLQIAAVRPPPLEPQTDGHAADKPADGHQHEA